MDDRTWVSTWILCIPSGHGVNLKHHSSNFESHPLLTLKSVQMCLKEPSLLSGGSVYLLRENEQTKIGWVCKITLSPLSVDVTPFGSREDCKNKWWQATSTYYDSSALLDHLWILSSIIVDFLELVFFQKRCLDNFII